MNSKKYINLEQVLKDKNPKLAKLLPRVIIRYLKRVIHEDELNEIVPKLQEFEGLSYVKEGLRLMNIESKVTGLENLDINGRYIFAGNHPLGGLDGLVMAHEVGKMYSDLKFLANDILMNLDGLNSIFLPVNKHGRQSVEYFTLIETAFNSNGQILTFPAGLCSRKIKGKITDLKWHKNFINRAVKHKRDVVPVFIEGRNSNFFYNLSNFRKFIGIKANIEMLYLVDEMFKQQGKVITIHFGKPISWTQFTDSKKVLDNTDLVRKDVYKLQANK